MLYLQFGDRDVLLVEAAADLVRRELLAEADADASGDAFAGVLAMARHFAAHRSFYRAMLTGSCAFAMTRTLNGLFGAANEKTVRQLFGDLNEQVARDLAAFVAGGTGAVVNDWLIDGAGPSTRSTLRSWRGACSVSPRCSPAAAARHPTEVPSDQTEQSPHPARAAPVPTPDQGPDGRT